MMMPTSFTNSNTHRLVHFNPDAKRSDIERLDDLAADAVEMTREALSLTPGFDTPTHNALHGNVSAIERHAARRHMLGDTCQADLDGCIEAVCKILEIDGTEDSVLVSFLALLREVLNRSHRVSDLIAAEREIGRMRGIGRG